MNTTPNRPDLAGDNSKRMGGASRSANARWLSKLIVLLCVVIGVPLEVQAQPAGGYSAPRRAWLGLAGEDAGGSQGVTVVDIQPGSPAASAGLRPGDQLGAVNGRPIRNYDELARQVAVLSPGTVLRFSVRRGSRVRDVAVTLGQPPASIPATRPTNGSRGRAPAPAPAPSPSRSSSEWSCRAVGTYAPPSSTEGPDYSDKQNVDVTKWGPTRDAAGFAAIDACSGMLHLQANPTLSPGSLVLEECRVIRCSR